MSLVLPPTLHLGAAGAGDDNRVGRRGHAVAAAARVVGPALEGLLLQSQGTALDLQLGRRDSAAAALFSRFRLVTHFLRALSTEVSVCVCACRGLKGFCQGVVGRKRDDDARILIRDLS